MAARGALRMLLGSYLDVEPHALRFELDPSGKPRLPGACPIHFNLSHSGSLAVYALTKIGDVGIDVELLDRGPPARVHPPDFLRHWVMREACAKRLGARVDNRGVGNTERPTPAATEEPWIHDFDLDAGAIVAVALAAEPVDFRVYAIHFSAHRSILPAGPLREPPATTQTFPSESPTQRALMQRKRLTT
jgi:hypothetical protein